MPRGVHAFLGQLVAATLLMVVSLARGAPSLPPRYVEGELLVKFKGGPRGPEAAQARQAFRHEVKRHFDHVGWQHIQLPPGLTVVDALAEYQHHPAVLAVEPNYLHRVVPLSCNVGLIPQDPRFKEQWALPTIGATNAWATTPGSSNVVVAVIDTGVNYNHEDLAANMWRNPGETGLGTNGLDKATNGVDDDRNGYVDDLHGIDVVSHDGFPMDGTSSGFYHGTMCAGIVGAVGNNGRGIAGVNWSVQLMALRFFHSSTTVSNYVDSVGFLEACTYVLDQKSRGVNVRVTNNSWGFTDDPGQIVRSALDTLGNAGILNVFAAGFDIFGTGQGTNLDTNPIFFPQYWHLPSMINVAASDQADSLVVSKSNWGLTNVDLAAPGVNILTTDGSNPTNYLQVAGADTSPACALVAGAVALLAAAYPSATASQIKTALLESVDVVDDLTNRVASGGRLNVAQALLHPCLATNAPSFVTRAPESQTNGLGCSTTFCVTATGAQPMHYSWQFNGTNLADGDGVSGATTPALTLPNVQLSDAGAYAVVVSNAFGMATSAVATLTVEDCPVIQAQPRSLTVVDRTNVSFSVTAVGACPLTFQWQRDGQDIPGATSATLTLTNVSTLDSNDFQVVVGNACGSVTSDAATLTVLGWPWIVAQPRSQTVALGSDVTLSVALADTAALPVGFRWRRNSTFLGWAINGVTNVVSLPNIQTNSAGAWSAALITNAATHLMARIAASGTAYVTVVKPPASQMVWAGQTAAFAANAVGPAPLRYQWQFNGVNLLNETRTNLVLNPVQPSQAGDYTLVVTNAAGEPTGFSARLHVLVPCEEPSPPPVPCTNATVRLVRCLDRQASCVEIRWPSSACPLPLEWTEDLSQANWQPFPAGPISPGADCACVLILVSHESMFFRFRCSSALGP